MKRTRLLFCSLLSSGFGARYEDAILAKLAEEYVREYAGIYDLRLLLGSAHPASLEQACAVLAGYEIAVQYVHVPFQMQDNFNVRRGHEIGFGKQYLLRQLVPGDFDFLLNIDSDIYISFADCDKLIRLLLRPRQFVNIPYVLHRRHRFGRIQLGAYIHSAQLLKTIDYSAAVYRTKVCHGKVERRQAPDCAARDCLRARGGKEIRAVPGVVSITTHHYSSAGVYGRYDAGQISRHWNAEGWLGFDPVIALAAMDLQCCTALSNFARAIQAQSALVLGDHYGNAIGSLAAAGIEEVLTAASESAVSRPAERVFERFTGSAISFHHRPLESFDGVNSCDLSDFRDRHFDLAVIDGPSDDPPQRIAAAMQVDAAHYVFPNGERDAAAIRQFIHHKRMQGLPCSVARNATAQGLTIVSLWKAGRQLEGNFIPQRIDRELTPVH